MHKYIFVIILLSFLNVTHAQDNDVAMALVNGKIKSMSLDEKIGQLFMIRAHSDLGADHIKEIENQIKKYHVGGLCFFQGTPTKQAELTNKYQGLSKVPLLISMDAETGLGFRHKKSAISYPKQLTLGAISDNTAIYDMGVDIAYHLKRIGVNINFAPVVDVNNNPANPVIHNRSFGEDIFNVATKSYAYSKGMQDNGIIACAKHFPGHGDTDVDSHLDLPIIKHSRKRLDSLELMPFRVMSQLGIKSIMTAHLSVPAIDDEPNRPTSLSKKAIQDLLIEEFNYEGLIITDALEMQGVAKNFKPGDMEIEALKAGNDILLLPIDIAKSFQKIKTEVESGRLDEELIDKKVAKILHAKHDLKLKNHARIRNLSSIDEDVNSATSLALKTKLYEKAITLVKDDKDQIPLTEFSQFNKVASLTLGTSKKSTFQNMLSNFGITKHIFVNKVFNAKEIANELNSYETIIISLQDLSIYQSKKFGITQNQFDIIYNLNTTKNVILIVHGTPYTLKYFTMIPTLIAAYEDNELMQNAVAQALVGVSEIQGSLPVTVHEEFPIKTGIKRSSIHTLGFGTPESVGMISDSLLMIDTIVSEMIGNGSAPGCQILAAKNGRIFFQKSYGYHTPNKKKKVKNTDIYDVASVTKILSTTISLMKLYDEGEFILYEPLKKHLPQLDTTNKGDLIIEDVLAHYSGLPGWIPFYEDTMDDESKTPKRISEYFKSTPTKGYDLKLTEKLFLRNDWQDSIYNMIYNCDLREKRDYRYSDLGFYLFRQMIEQKSKFPFDKYCDQSFYEPMGLKNTLFNPWRKIDLKRIPPSEKDNYFRLEDIKGYVHDMGAAMLSGVSGHAGLFSNSKDLATLMQMLLNGGSYGGTQYITPKTVRKFTKRYYKSTRRGLGFDLKQLDEDEYLNMAEEASSAAFGHLGFTGISVYADPKYDLIYIFLSNRTYPTMKNSSFSKKNYRPRVQSVFYRSMMKRQLN